MKRIADIMTHELTVISPDDNLQHAAQLMRDDDIGAIPVCDGKRLVGMITDRDITIRAVAQGKPPAQVRVADVMSTDVSWCFEDQTVGEVLQQMGGDQLRRMPVLSRNLELSGIVSLGDLATRSDADMDSALEDISAPMAPAPRATARQPERH